MPKEKGRKVIAANRKARHDYAIDTTYECGLVLTLPLRLTRCAVPVLPAMR